MTDQASTGQRVVLRCHPDGALSTDNFELGSMPVPEPKDGEFLVRNRFISVDPMLRLFIDAKPLGGAMPALPEGTTIPGAAVGEVIASNNPTFAAGDIVEGRFGWQSHAVSNGAGITRVSPLIGPAENALGVGGLPGFTAYCGIAAAGGVKPGQTWLVSGAAGAVGSVVGPLVKARGGRVVGIAGGSAKRDYLIANCGYDAVADRNSPDFHQHLRDALPQGADVYFDNVGGPMLADMVPYLGRGALILICGLMSQYQDATGGSTRDRLPEVLQAVMFNGLRIQAFTQVGQDAQRPAFEQEISELLESGALKSDLHIEQGLESLPQAMVNLFERSTTGKVVVRLD